MTDLEGIVEDPRKRGGEESEPEVGRDLAHLKGKRRNWSRKRRNSTGSEGSFQSLPSGQDPEKGWKGDASAGQNSGQQANGRKQVLPSTQEDPRARFFDDYHKEAEEYDREFIEKYDEDLNTTLIFAGLFSAVTSAFIIEVHSHLQQNPNDETAALLRVLIHKIDNTTFGNNPPALPQWTGPSNTIVQVQAILLASLTASLLSAFLAMLGKQWLNRFVSTDMRGTAIERSQNRQRKLDGIVTWYFDHVMESLPLMLQAALLLLGCALSRYLWDINITVASVVLAVTSFGIIFYIFIIIAGTASESCPYQTPGARFLRYMFLNILPSAFHSFHSVARKVFIFVSSGLHGLVRGSFCCRLLVYWWSSANNIAAFLCFVIQMPGALIMDLCFLGPVMLVVTLGRIMRHLLFSLVTVVYRWYTSTPRMHGLGQQTIVLDLRCISWMLQTSLDKRVHLSTLKHLATMMTLADFDPALVSGCFDVFVGCIKVDINHKVVIMQGLEQLAAVSAMCFLRTFHQLSAADPGSNVLRDVRKRYKRVFPINTDFRGLPFYYTITKIHALANQLWNPRRIQWDDYRPSAQECISFTRSVAEVAHLVYWQTRHQKIPRWTLRFALHSLSLDPIPPTSAIADCLSIIAIDLGCDVSNTGFTISDERVRVEQVVNLITQRLKMMAEDEDWRSIGFKRKAITALLPYAVERERDGQPEMLGAFLQAARASKNWDFTWNTIRRYASRIPRETSPRAIVLVLPHIRWSWLTDREDLIQRWAVAASAVPCTEEVAQCVVNTLLQIASQRELLSHIPTDTWSWLTKRPSLPPICRGRDVGTRAHVVRAVRALKDIEVLKSYFLLIWSAWNHFSSNSSGSTPSHRPPAPSSFYIPGIRPNPSVSNSSDHESSRRPHSIRDGSILRPHLPQGLGSISIRHPLSVISRASSPHQPCIPDRISTHHSHSGSDNTSSRYPPYRRPSRRPPYRMPNAHLPPNETPTPRPTNISDSTLGYHSPYDLNRPGTSYPHQPPNSYPLSPNIPQPRISSSFFEMQISIQEDFGGIGMGHHRADLVQRLDHVLERLNRGLEYLKQHNPEFEEHHLVEMKSTYQKLRETLLDVDADAERMQMRTRTRIRK